MRARLTVLAVAFALGCGELPTDSTEPESATEYSDARADIYGADSRRELHDPAVSSTHRHLARSTALMVTGRAFFDITDTTVELSGRTLAERKRGELGAPLCASEPFRDQPAPGFCSAFLIAPDLVATAGHCVNINTPVHRANYVFGFGYDSVGDDDVRTISRADVYQGKTVVGHLYDWGEQTLEELTSGDLWHDWAVVQLDRPVDGRPPIDLRDTPLGDGDIVTAIGHPSGLPTKITRGRVVDDTSDRYVNTDLDIYSGNSGSLVADEAGQAAGIVVRGTGGSSFEMTEDACFQSRRCDDVDDGDIRCSGNHVMRGAALQPFVDPGTGRVVSYQLPSSTANIPDGDAGGVSLTQDVPADGFVSFVTLNVNLSHQDASELSFFLEHEGESVALAQHPKVWSGGEVRFSRTSYAFDGVEADGAWTLKVVDSSADGGTYQTVDWWQLVVGTVDSPPQPDAPSESWVGTECVDDDDCAFADGETPGFCYDFDTAEGRRGFCSLPCEGYCPDRVGFAPTFCVASDTAGTGICASKSGVWNRWCSSIEGTTARETGRYVGDSTAPDATQTVCLPEG